jgi:hypothetical protein
MTVAEERPYPNPNSAGQPDESQSHTLDITTELTTIKKLDAGKALMLLEKSNANLIARTLYHTSGLSFGEILTKTNLSTNQLNYTLSEMRALDLIVQVEKKYFLTKYAVLLLGVLMKAKSEIKDFTNKGGQLLAPSNGSTA